MIIMIITEWNPLHKIMIHFVKAKLSTNLIENTIIKCELELRNTYCK